MKTKANNEVTLAFPSRSSNEGFARAAVSCFAAQMDPTLNELADIEKARQPMFTTGGEERSGMGFTSMESFMDRLVVRSTPGRGTTVVMRKRLAPRMQGTK